MLEQHEPKETRTRITPTGSEGARHVHRSSAHTRRVRDVDGVTALIIAAVITLAVVASNGRAPATDAAPPPPSGFSHGAAGSGRNGVGGSIAPSPTMRSWPGTGNSGNGGPFSFIGAHYGSLWQVPTSANNSAGVGYCVMEDVGGEGTVALQPDPVAWDAGEMARAAALMSTFGGDLVVPYGIDASGTYDVASGEWQFAALFGGGEYTRRRHVAVNFGVKMLVEDVSPTGAVAGLKLARDTAVVTGTGADFSALRNGYEVAKQLAAVADAQHAVGGVRLEAKWATPGGLAPTQPGSYPLEVAVLDANDKPVGFVPVVVMSEVGIGSARTRGAVVTVDRTGESPDDAARWEAAAELDWPTLDMASRFATDRRFSLGTNPLGADVTDTNGIAEFDVTITAADWELGLHTQAPTADVSLYAGTGIQGQITWSGPPQSTSVRVAAPSPPPATTTTTTSTTTSTTTTMPTPIRQEVVIRKVLDAADVQGGRDMSGFEFEVTARDSDLNARLTTRPNGLTQPFAATAGVYTVREIGRPSWASGLHDGGPVTFDFEPGVDGDRVEVVYTNVVPGASISTSATDARDGDRTADLALGDATIVDTVTYTGLVPNTEYVISGELMVRPADHASIPATRSRRDPDAPSAAVTGANGAGATAGGHVDAPSGAATSAVASSAVARVEMIPTGIVASTSFSPTTPDGDVEVRFDVPAAAALEARTVVVYQRLAVASTGRVIAVHADPHASAQTIRFVDIVVPTTITTTTPTTTTTTAATTATTVPDTVPEPPPTSPETTAPPTSVAAANPPPASSSTTTSTVSAPMASPTGQLPRTGGDGPSTISVVGLSIVMLGCALVLAAGPTANRRGRTVSAPGGAAVRTRSVGHQRNGETEADLGADRGDAAAWLHRILRR